MKTLILVLILGAASLMLTACATSRSTAQIDGAANAIKTMYPISDGQADKVLGKAMTFVFPGASIVRVDLPYKGYLVYRRVALDSHVVTARMVPAKGLGKTGNMVDGYTFEVIDDGTLIVSGPASARQLFSKIIEYANLEAQPIPLAIQ
jgi:predicted small secreted protein